MIQLFFRETLLFYIFIELSELCLKWNDNRNERCLNSKS
jgi:hypothetical protein